MTLTGNEDGAKHCAMNILYSLQHLGYVIPPQVQDYAFARSEIAPKGRRTVATGGSPWLEMPPQNPKPRRGDGACPRRHFCDRSQTQTHNREADAAWLGEAGPGPSSLDPGSGGPENDFTNRNTTFMTWNLLHLARMIKDAGGIPAHGNQRSKWDAGCRFDHPNPLYR